MARPKTHQTQSKHRQFSFEQAQIVLPKIQSLTAQAVHEVESCLGRLHREPEDERLRAEVHRECNRIVQSWAQEVHRLGAVVNGLWLVDFDNGEGFYCWKYPEPMIEFYHDYDAGFAGRRQIAETRVH
ncbi:MAG TPA: DUF2203 family protein [Acidobacteriota bacterium]